MRLKNKIALVTGSSSGIGKAIAIGFAKEGADIIINYLHRKKEADEVADTIKSLGRKVLVFKADVSKKNDVENMISDAWNSFGQIDILINNSGITIERSLLGLSEEEWDNIIDVNLKGTFLCNSEVARRMVKNKIKGHIINISSVNSIEVEINRGVYNTSKGGIDLLTKSFAAELGRYGIHVNGIAFGSISGTNIAGEFFDNSEIIEKIIDKNPLGYIGNTEECVGPAVFLASKDSNYVQGEILVVDGGLTILKYGDKLIF
jgi:3-oxoacyl-[acyl-carrier protein] reductase